MTAAPDTDLEPADQPDDEVLMAAAAFAVRQHLAAHPAAVYHRDDFISDARFGAATAYTRFDPAKGASLFTFALRRAAGAITDGIRQRVPVSRGDFAKDPVAAAAALAQRMPTSLEALADGGWTAGASEVGYEHTEDHDQVVRLLERCTPTEQLVLVAVVMYGFTQTEVASWLGLSLARVNQVQRRALARLRAAVSA